MSNGIKNSYEGLLDTDEIIHLTPEKVWHMDGDTIRTAGEIGICFGD